ncbi:MAG: hypothetical protein H0V46_00685 [Sphingomonas sp.]|nr:hypothetical protein [Sphingomonas sp.]
MSARSFRSVFMVASCAGAALGCYLVSLRVASERAALENVETEIVMAQRDIRLLQTEIGTRGRLAQLERWNVKVLALSAPSADQFLDGGFALAKMVAPRDDKVDLDAPVVLAAAPANGPRPQIQGARQAGSDDAEIGVSARQMLHVASIKREDIKREALPVAGDPPKPAKLTAATTKKSAPQPARAVKAPAKIAVAAKARPARSDRKAAAVDPLAPIETSPRAKKVATSTPRGPVKENGSQQ